MANSNIDKPIGKIKGIKIGQDFKGGIELSESRVHPWQQRGKKGFQFGGIVSDDNECAISIVLSGSYIDDEDHDDYLIYTGQGGRDEAGNQVMDQVIEGRRGKNNRAMINSYKQSIPIRVLRGYRHKSPLSPPKPYYRYSGIFYVKDYWKENSINGPIIYRFRLEKESSKNIKNSPTDKENKTHIEIINTVLQENIDKGSLHYHDIVRIAKNEGLLTKYGKTPERSFNRVLNRNQNGIFKAHGDGYFSLNSSESTPTKSRDASSRLLDYKLPSPISKSDYSAYAKSGSDERLTSTEEHNEMEICLAEFLKSKDFKLLKRTSPKTDLFWEDKNKNYFLAEIKSLRHKTLTRQTSQFRKAIGQIQEYKYRLGTLGHPIKKCFLAVTREPEEKMWYEICKKSEITLITYANYHEKLSKG